MLLVFCCSPAQAGAQLRTGKLADGALTKFHLPNWVPAFAGVEK
jgi:hypothetical protein